MLEMDLLRTPTVGQLVEYDLDDLQVLVREPSDSLRIDFNVRRHRNHGCLHHTCQWHTRVALMRDIGRDVWAGQTPSAVDLRFNMDTAEVRDSSCVGPTAGWYGSSRKQARGYR